MTTQQIRKNENLMEVFYKLALGREVKIHKTSNTFTNRYSTMKDIHDLYKKPSYIKECVESSIRQALNRVTENFYNYTLSGNSMFFTANCDIKIDNKYYNIYYTTNSLHITPYEN